MKLNEAIKIMGAQYKLNNINVVDVDLPRIIQQKALNCSKISVK